MLTLPLLLRKILDDVVQVVVDLLADDLLLHRILVRADDVEDVELTVTVVKYRHSLHFPVIVDLQVVGDAHDPLEELALLMVVARPDGVDDLDESVLENVFRKLLVFHREHDIREQPLFIARY